jgi:hypothetical protein
METVKIRIGSEFDGRGFQQADQGFDALTSQAKEFFDTLKMGVGIDLGGRLVQSIAEIPAMFQNALARGVQFKAKMHDAELAIAQVVGQFGNLDKAAAKNAAATAMAKIIELEPKTAGTLDGLVQGFMATVSASQSAGISIEQNISLVGAMANALSNANIPAEQLAQELRSIMTGSISMDSQLASTLGITNADVAKAKELGTLYEMLTKKLGSMGEAGDSFSVRQSSSSPPSTRLWPRSAGQSSTCFSKVCRRSPRNWTIPP